MHPHIQRSTNPYFFIVLCVFTECYAEFYELKSPLPYRMVKLKSIESSYGVSFAYGGRGVLDTLVLRPNMTNQIDFFENLLNHLSVYTKNDLETSLFLLSVGGNDYNTYSHNGGTDEGLPAFAQSIVNQIVVNLKRLHGLGSRKIMVTSLPPGGCLPKSTLIFQFQKCNDTYNRNLNIHNTLLSEAVVKLNNDYKDSSFIILDLFSSFKTLLFSKWFETPLKPCCMGIRDGYSCGSVEINIGERMYTECEDKETAFFWDDVHPTQAGWSAVFNFLSYTLQLIH